MRVLLYTQYFWPENADYKNHALAAALAERGHDVQVLTAFPNHPVGKIFAGYRQRWRKIEQRENYRVVRVPIYPAQSKRLLQRVACYGSFLLSSVIIGFPSVGKVDLIIVHATPIFLGITASLLKKMYGSVLVMDVLDLWPQAFSSASPAKMPSLLIRFITGCARFAYMMADRIHVPTEGFQTEIVKMGIRLEKVHLMPIWAEASPSLLQVDCLSDSHCSTVNVYYIGNLGPLQNLKPVILAWADINQRYPKLKLICVGDGTQRKELEKLSLSLRGNVSFLGALPKNEVSRLTQEADALLISLLDDSYLNINFPSKLSHYLSYGKPILAFTKGETSKILQLAKAGLCADEVNVDGMIGLLERYLQTSFEERVTMGNNGLQFFKDNYEKNQVVGHYIQVIEGQGTL